MLRVSKAEGRSGTVVTIDGQLVSDCIDVVENCCIQAMLTGRPVQLYLRDVSMVDQAARDLLRKLARKGVQLLATGIYTSYVVQKLNQAGAEQRKW